MRNTTITIQRPEGTVLVTGLPVQVDQASIQEVVAHHQQYDYHTYDAFKVYTQGWYPNSLLQQDDVLFDELYTDPNTAAPFKYRVIGRVKDYFYDHQEAYCEVVPGT